MPPRKKSAKHPQSAKGWDRPILSATTSDDDWNYFVAICKADGGVSQSFLTAMGPEIAKGTRQKFQHISLATLIQWAKDQAKVKSKSKDPLDGAIAEACQLVASHADSSDGVPPAILARAVKGRIILQRRAFIAKLEETRAAGRESTSSVRPGASAKARKSAKGKKGKGDGGDGPGKKPTTMVKRADEPIKTADDEPENCPTCFFVLEGFDSPDFIREMSLCSIAVAVIICTRAANVDGEAAYAEPPPEEREDPEENRRRLTDYESAVRGFALSSPTGSALRNLSWLDLPVGILGTVDPHEVFDKVAKLAYLTLERRADYQAYLDSLDKNTVPAVGESDWSSVANTYRALVDAVPVDRCGVDTVLDCIVQAVAAVNDDSAPTPVVDDAVAAEIHRYGDAVSCATIGLEPSLCEAVLAAGRRVAAASIGATYCRPAEVDRSIRADTELHRLRKASSLTPSDTDFAWRQLQFEKLLQTDLTDWSVSESHGARTLCQVLGAALRQYRDVRVMEDTLQGTKLVAVLNDSGDSDRRHCDWNIRCDSFVDFANFRDHVVAALEAESSSEKSRIGYDIGDILLDVSGSEDTYPIPQLGEISEDTVQIKMGEKYSRRTIQVGGTSLTQHFNPNTNECTRIVAALADGSFATMQQAQQPDTEVAPPAPEPSQESDTPAAPVEPESAETDRTIYDGALKASPTAIMSIGTTAGLEVSLLQNGTVRQRLLDSTLHRVGRHLDLGMVACEASRTYLKDGSVVRSFHSRSIEVLTASGTLHRRCPAGDWTTTFSDGSRTLTTANGETSALGALRITTRTDPVTGSVVRTRADKVVMVSHVNGGSAVEYPDGTRVYTAAPAANEEFQTRIECLGMGRVMWATWGVRVALPSGTCVENRTAEGTFLATQPTQSVLTFTPAGTGRIQSQLGGAVDFSFGKQTDAATIASGNADDSMACGVPSFRLFEIKPDGSGFEILSAAQASLYAKAIEADETSRAIENPVPGSQGARSVAYIVTTAEENAFQAAYSESSVLPTSLQRRAVPYTLASTIQSKPARIVRQLVYNTPLSGDRRTSFTAEVAAFMVAAETSVPCDVNDERSAEEVAEATLLAEAEIAGAVVPLTDADAESLKQHAQTAAPPPSTAVIKGSSTIALHDSLKDTNFLEAFQLLTTDPPPPPRGIDLIDPAMKVFDDWFKDGRTTESLNLQLASTVVPKYWNSEEFHAYIEANGPIKEETTQDTSQTNAGSTIEVNSGEGAPLPGDGLEETKLVPPGSKYGVLPPISGGSDSQLNETMRLE